MSDNLTLTSDRAPEICEAADIRASLYAAVHAEAFVDGPRPWAAKEFARFNEEPSVLAIEARDADDDVLGFALVRELVDEAELLTICRRPAARGLGVG